MPEMNFAKEDNEWHLENGGAAKNMLLKYFYGLRLPTILHFGIPLEFF